MKAILRLFSIVLIILILLCSYCMLVNADQVLLQKTQAHAEKALLDDNEYANNAGNSHYDWEALSAALCGDKGKEYLYSLSKNLPEPECANATDLHRTAVLIYAMGGNPQSVCGRNLIEESVFYRKDLGKQGANGYIWALITLDAYNIPTPDNAVNTRDSIIADLLKLQNENGGFGITKKKSDIDITAMAVTALSKYKDEAKINTATEKALDWISQQQLSQGDFGSWGVANAEATAQVVIALRTAGIDIFNDRRFIKNGNTVCDGLMKYYRKDGFIHTVEDNSPTRFANGQGFCALAAINKDGSIFDFNHLTLATIDQATLDNTEENSDDGISIKSILLIAISSIGLIAAVIAGIKRKSLTAFIIILLAFLLLALLASAIKIQTPEEYYNENLEDAAPDSQIVTISIRCDEVINSNNFDKSLIENGFIPEDGIILPCCDYVLRDGDSAFDILQRVTRYKQIQLEFSGTTDNAYIEGISYLYEFACGNGSGWVYKVNGESPNYGVSQYIPADGDKIEFIYVLSYN